MTIAVTGAVVGGVAALGSAGASIYSATQSGGGGGGSSNMASLPVALNPAHNTLNYIFGKSQHLNQNSIFGQGFIDQLQNYLNNPLSFPGTGELGQPANGPSILSLLGSPQQIQQNLNTGLGYLDQGLGVTSGFAANGNPTDANPIYSEALRQFNTSILPQLAETSGLGTQSGGLQAQGALAGQALMSQAAAQQVGLNEAAKSRQLQAVPLLSSLAASRQALPINLANDLFSIYNTDATKGLNMFGSLYNLGNGQQFFQGGYNPTDPTAAAIGASAGSLGNLANNFSNFFSNNSPSTYSPQVPNYSYQPTPYDSMVSGQTPLYQPLQNPISSWY